MADFLRTLPNILTVFRMIAGPVGAICLIASYGADSGRDFLGVNLTGFSEQAGLLAIASLILFVTGALSDLFDGMLARHLNAQSQFGVLMDPIADKVFVATWLIAWVWLLGGNWLMAVPAAAIIARDLVMTVIRITQSRDGDAAHPVSSNAKLKTTAEMITLGFPFLIGILAHADIAAMSWPSIEIWVVLLWISAALSLYTAIGYFLPRNTPIR